MADHIPHITCEHFLKIDKLKEPEHVVIDLRDTIEFDAGHIEGSKNVPRRELHDILPNVIPEKHTRVIAVIGPTHGSEIDSVYEDIKALGYEKVEFLAGGFDKYCEIANIEAPDEGELTPEEMGFTGDELEDEGADPDHEENEPLL
jgi:rhodanese-related sulfurtransferase